VHKGWKHLKCVMGSWKHLCTALILLITLTWVTFTDNQLGPRGDQYLSKYTFPML